MLVDDLLREASDDHGLKVAEQAFQNEVSSGKPSADATFLYAYFLLRSKESDVKLGISLLSDLLNGSGSSKEDKLDYLFYTAVGHARLKNFDFALQLLDGMLEDDALNDRAKVMKEAIERRIVQGNNEHVRTVTLTLHSFLS
uniref:Epsilon-coat protein n=1 Tax=Trichuris muris TaxID=70415 RepID=A0A5S6Q569_TRIMR